MTKDPRAQAPANPPAGTWLGFDYGLKRLGVAVGQTLTGRANPLTILDADQGKPDWQAIASLIEEWRPSALVVGLPRHADGSDNAVTPKAHRFARQLQGRFHRPVLLVDEHLSSHAARDMAQAAGKRLGPRDAIDDWAAACILDDGLAGLAMGIDAGMEKDEE